MTTQHRTSSKLTWHGGSYDLRTGFAAPDGWYTVPKDGTLFDCSWDGRGESVEVKAGDRVRLVSRGSAHALAVIEVAR